MLELLVAGLLTCAEAEGLIENISSNSYGQSISIEHKQEIIETLKENSDPECYEGSELS